METVKQIIRNVLWVSILFAVTCYSYADVTEEPPVFVRQWETPAPWGAAVDNSGNVLVVDPANMLIREFDLTGVLLYAWSNCGAANPSECASLPSDIALDSHGNVYVANQNGVAKFDHNGSFQMKFGSSNAFGSGLAVYSDSASDSTTYIYVTNRLYNTVQRYTSDGLLVTQWGGSGTQPGQFNSPYDVAVDSGGNVYVADTYNSRIQKFDPDGRYVLEWPTQTVTGLAVDLFDNIYAVSRSQNCVQKFTSNGFLIYQWGEGGTEEGRFASPSRLNAGAHGLIYVSDTGNNRIQVFGPAFVDSDNDGIEDSEDNCAYAPNPLQEDADQDSAGDACDACPYDPDDDIDGDGICGDVDNCPEYASIDQFDIDEDGIGDICDPCDNRPVPRTAFLAGILWPPDHSMIPVTIDTADFALNNPPYKVEIESVDIIELNSKAKGIRIQNESEMPDFEITGSLSLNLRSERSTNSLGRTYAVSVTVEDCSGQHGFTAEFVVPHDRDR